MTGDSKQGSMLRKLLKQFGIVDDPRWSAIVLFVRNLVRDLSVFTSRDKAAIQQQIFHDLSARDFSDDRYASVLSRLDAFIENNTTTMELKTALEAEKRSTEALIAEMEGTVSALRDSGTHQQEKLDTARSNTEKAITTCQNRKEIIEKVRAEFNTLVAELREEASEWEARAKRLEHTARFDPLLTELHNRSALDSHLLEMVVKHRSTGKPLVMMMIDVDHFKNVNDTHGHQVGDEVLKTLARIVSSQAMLFDGFSARYGGEELAIVAHDISIEDAFFKGEAIRRDVEAAKVRPRVKGYGGGELSFTVSVGVAALEPGWQASDLLRAADKALYKAKDNGRNRVETHTEDDL